MARELEWNLGLVWNLELAWNFYFWSNLCMNCLLSSVNKKSVTFSSIMFWLCCFHCVLCYFCVLALLFCLEDVTGTELDKMNSGSI